MRRHSPALLAAGWWLLGALGGAQAQEAPLSSQQSELLGLISVLQIASAACQYEADTKVLGLSLRHEGLTLNTEREKKVVATTMADARARFSGGKRGVECLAILDEYGPHGTRISGLLRRH